MANEHTLFVEKTFDVGMTVTDGVGIEKGTLLEHADPNTVSKSAGANQVVGGIAMREKIADSGVTNISVKRGPGDQFKATASLAISAGDPIGSSATADNFVVSIVNDANLSKMKRLGYALETVADGETILYELNIGVGA